jgi:adenylosuccinate lyase
VERVIFPDTFILVDFLLAETINIIQNWHVYPEKMKKNLELTRGLIFSQRVLLVLTDKGLSREKAYQLVQRNSLKAWEEHHDLLPLLLADDEVTAVLSPEEIKNCFTLEPFLSQIDYIYERVLSDES